MNPIFLEFKIAGKETGVNLQDINFITVNLRQNDKVEIHHPGAHTPVKIDDTIGDVRAQIRELGLEQTLLLLTKDQGSRNVFIVNIGNAVTIAPCGEKTLITMRQGPNSMPTVWEKKEQIDLMRGRVVRAAGAPTRDVA